MITGSWDSEKGLIATHLYTVGIFKGPDASHCRHPYLLFLQVARTFLTRTLFQTDFHAEHGSSVVGDEGYL